MIARLLISPHIPGRVGEIEKNLAGVGLKNPHPDVLYFNSDSKLGIEQARKIKEHFSLKPYSAPGRGVVLEDASQLTDEAQNALLKTLEELPKHGLFILGASSDAQLLPTVLSRCQIVHLNSLTTSDVEQSVTIEELLEATIEERFEYIEKLKDRDEFLHFLVRYFHQNLASHSSSGNTDYIAYTKELLQAEEWAKQNVNMRGILEYLMLVMPSTK